MSKLSIVGRISANSKELKLDVVNAMVSIRHEVRADIEVTASNADGWQIDGHTIRQTVNSKGSSDVVKNNYDGAKIAIGGSVQGAKIQIGGLAGGGSISIGGSVVGGTINIGGQQTECRDLIVVVPDSVVKTGELERLEIVVPSDLRASLALFNAGKGDVTLDFWQDGDFQAQVLGNGGLKVERLEADVVQLNGEGNGNFKIAAVVTKSLQATLTGNGNLDVHTVETDALTIVQTGNGETTITDGSAKAGSVVCSGIGNMTLGWRFANISKVSTGLGKVYITARQ